MVQPGTFRVTLNKVADGQLTPVGTPQEFKVVPLPTAKPAPANPAPAQ
jgi:hypothetical protein